LTGQEAKEEEEEQRKALVEGDFLKLVITINRMSSRVYEAIPWTIKRRLATKEIASLKESFGHLVLMTTYYK